MWYSGRSTRIGESCRKLLTRSASQGLDSGSDLIGRLEALSDVCRPGEAVARGQFENQKGTREARVPGTKCCDEAEILPTGRAWQSHTWVIGSPNSTACVRTASVTHAYSVRHLQSKIEQTRTGHSGTFRRHARASSPNLRSWFGSGSRGPNPYPVQLYALRSHEHCFRSRRRASALGVSTRLRNTPNLRMAKRSAIQLASVRAPLQTGITLTSYCGTSRTGIVAPGTTLRTLREPTGACLGARNILHIGAPTKVVIAGGRIRNFRESVTAGARTGPFVPPPQFPELCNIEQTFSLHFSYSSESGTNGMATLSAVSRDFSRHLFKDGERVLILSNCLACGEARIGSSYDGFLQEWESSHTCASCSKAASA
jgi:hypothetical protein